MEALLFDVQGTATDFFTTVRDAAAAVLGPRFPQRDWPSFVNDCPVERGWTT
jgi:2-haloacid dehalogenase